MFTLQISTRNAAFKADGDVPAVNVYAARRELARILRRVAHDLEDSSLGIDQGTARDANGNTVAEWVLTDDAPTPAENVQRYMDALDALEIPPNGDDANALHALALGGPYTAPHKGGR
jgi:hypothetical protein